MKSLKVDLLKDPILKALVLFALPLLISNIFQQLYNTADNVIVGRYLGEAALAAVGASMAVFQLLVGFSQGFSNGMAMVTARSYGTQNEDLIKQSVASAIVIGTAVIGVMMLVSRLFLRNLLILLRTPEAIMDDAYAYIAIVTTFIGVMFAYNLCAGLYRAVGNSLMPLVFLILAACVNVALDLLFILKFGMGIKGAAIATVIAQGLSVVLSLTYIKFKIPILIPQRRHFRFDKKIYSEMLGQGSSMAVMYSLIFVGTIVLQYAINDMGYLVIAGHTTARRLNSFFVMPIATIANSVGTFVSQNRGAGNKERIVQGVRYGRFLVSGWAIVITVVVWLSADFMVHFISGSGDAVVLQTGRTYLLWNAPFYIILGILLVTRFALQGMGEKLLPLISSLIEMGMKILFVAVIIPRMGYFGVIISEPVIWILMTSQLLYVYKKNAYLGTD